MKKLLKVLLALVVALLLLGGALFLGSGLRYSSQDRQARATLSDSVPTLDVDGATFRDLNKNGRLDPYEDGRAPVEERIDDLLGQMTVEEKAGLFFHTIMGIGENGEVIDKPGPMAPMATSELIITRHIRHFNLFRTPTAPQLARWHNEIQDMAARTRLGIPVMISSDPRHGLGKLSGINFQSVGFSSWPEPIGLAATRDAALVEEFGRIANQEYRAVGIRTALHPMADLATEPRWARVSGTFGEDADLAAEMTAAYIRGFQGDELGPESVACMTKHFPGGGPQKDGWDAHFGYGKDQVYPGGQFEYHMRPFVPALELGTAQVMPYYGIPVDQTSENVGMSFNRDVVTGLLRDELGYDGVVCTDWLILDEVSLFFGAMTIQAKAHGVEDLSVPERMKKALDAGVDQFGGHHITEVLLGLVQADEVTEDRLDVSARRMLRNMYALGLFDDPFVDTDRTAEVVGRADFVEAGKRAQRKSVVLLKAGKGGETTLPLDEDAGLRLYLENVDGGLAGAYGQVVPTVEEADVAILRLEAPYEPRDGDMLEQMLHQGYLDFQDPELGRLLGIMKATPTVVAITMDRPPVMPEIAEEAAGLLGVFGATDEIVLEAVFGRFNPTGKLPFELPSSMEAVEKQHEDVPYDSENPTFPFGFGLSYEDEVAGNGEVAGEDGDGDEMTGDEGSA